MTKLSLLIFNLLTMWHMQVRNLIKRIEPEFQTVEYCLSDEFRALYFVPKEELLEYLDIGRDEELLPPELRTKI